MLLPSLETQRLPGESATKLWLQRYSRSYLTIKCGDWSYGRPYLQCAENDVSRTLEIGRYCSIGDDVRIHVGRQGRHALDTLSTYPIGMAVSKETLARIPPVPTRIDDNLDISIGHDVWIASRATIMAGVRVGTGAVIGAGAVVTKDIPAFGIAVGVPAEVKKYRHPESTRQRILASRWWELEPDELWEACSGGAPSNDVLYVLSSLEAYRNRTTRAPLANKSLEQIYSLFAGGGTDNIPRWPDETEQKHYTGGSGVPLLRRAELFIEALEADGAFANPEWKGLDYGCGWGRIASYLLTRGSPEQLDMCDAWPSSIDLAKAGGFRNRMFLVSDIIREGEIPAQSYDFCYAMSVFTHLDRAAFESNIQSLLAGLKQGGKLYFTVRFQSFLDNLIALGRVGEAEKMDADGFWHITYPNKERYGETAVTRAYVENLCGRFGEVKYLGSPEFEQFLFRIIKKHG